MILGEIKWFDNKKGYGFIEWSETEDVLLHYSVIEGNFYKKLEKGDKVYFILDKKGSKLIAKKARILT